MSDKEIRYIVKGRNAGKSATSLARDMKVTPRHVRRIYARYRRTGKMHVQQKAGRKAAPQPAAGQVQAVLDMHCIEHVGVMRTAMRLQDAGHIISYNSVYRIMKEQGLVAASDTKSGQKKWLRYERKYSNAMWHVDWHEMKDPRLRGLKLVTFLDDSSRCVTAARTFAGSTALKRRNPAKFGPHQVVQCIIGCVGLKLFWIAFYQYATRVLPPPEDITWKAW